MVTETNNVSNTNLISLNGESNVIYPISRPLGAKDAGTGGVGKESPCDIDGLKKNGSDDPLM